MLRRVGILFAFAYGLALLGLYVGVFINHLTYVPQGLRSRAWPSVVGRVQQSQTDSYGRGSILHVEYEFQLNGAGYTSSRFRFSPKNGPSKGEWPWEDLAPGKDVTVFYNADDPNQCVLEPGVSPSVWFPSAGMGAVLALFAVILWKSLRRNPATRGTETSTAAIN